jgi:Lrp/AsnC family transcriptional regulator for asnA, asnC and gidA
MPFDYGIIAELQKNGRESYKRIAQRLGVSDGTVRLRTERMMRAGYLRVTASVNPLFFETQISAMVGICLDHPANEAIIRRIADMSGVQSVINVTGRFDLLAECVRHLAARPAPFFWWSTWPPWAG